ncbi:DinB family protein [Spongiimicrobium salis]|uniref:DinB family protein n=1 Tax=Spongiimicrobium salis TaxID=1667022 RepID=UPI00374D9B6A
MKTSALNTNEYHTYYAPYINGLGEVDLLEKLKMGLENFPQFMGSIPEDKLSYTYEEGKWTIAEILMHLIDAERVFQYRALRFGRGDETPLNGFDQDVFVPTSNANNRTLESIIAEFKAVRAATITLFDSFDDTVLKQQGTASDAKISVAAIGFIICGHQKHHKRLIKERYL